MTREDGSRSGGGIPLSGWAGREPVLIGSLRDASLPPASDLDRLARRIWEEVEGSGAGAWDRLKPASKAYRRTMRIARAALGISFPPTPRGPGQAGSRNR